MLLTIRAPLLYGKKYRYKHGDAMITHPLLGPLDEKTIPELEETISSLTKKIGYMSRMHNQAMLNQLIMVLNSYKSEYNKRQAELIEKNQSNMKNKIIIQ